MAGLESTAAFAERAIQVGMDPAFFKELADKHLDTFGKLAFVCSCRPNSGDDAPLFQAVKDLIGKDVPQKETMTLRRLWFEAHSHALVDLEARASRTGDTSPRELPLAERMSRLKRQRADLKGIELDVRTEPGHCLVDRVQAMLDSAQVLYLAPEKCVARQDEINGDKAEQKLTFSADGSIKVTKQAMQLRCEASGELKLRQCYLRRALAFDQVGLAGFTVQEAWHNRMFQALLEPPPAGYRYTTVQQIIAADQKYWHVVSQESRGSLTVGVGLPPPLDVRLKAAAQNPLVLACLTPLPKPVEHPQQAPHVPKGKSKEGKGGAKGSKGKGKGKDGAASPQNASLKELLDSLPQGCVRATEENRFICPFFNKGICRFQRRKSCRFGKHCCNFRGCYGDKPYIECKH